MGSSQQMNPSVELGPFPLRFQYPFDGQESVFEISTVETPGVNNTQTGF